ncbi:hypothetical protein DFJ73DRAFT_759825 [Zopfochytrium polystomum]|nr:hypothetical protein DFJ73DRAFT_759825 [Zopfochytrium polystomum]
MRPRSLYPTLGGESLCLTPLRPPSSLGHPSKVAPRFGSPWLQRTLVRLRRLRPALSPLPSTTPQPQGNLPSGFMDDVFWAGFLGYPNLFLSITSSALLREYGTGASTFDPENPTDLFCESSVQHYLLADAVLACLAVIALVVLYMPIDIFNGRLHNFQDLCNLPATIALSFIALAKALVPFAGLAAAFPTGMSQCKSGNFVLWAYSAFLTVGTLAGVLMVLNTVVSSVFLESVIAPRLYDYMFLAFNAVIVGATTFFLMRNDTPYSAPNDLLSSPWSTSGRSANISYLDGASGREPALCEQCISSYLYFELTLSLSIVAQLVAWFTYKTFKKVSGEQSKKWCLRFESAYPFTLLLKLSSLIYGAVKVSTVTICPTFNPPLYQVAKYLMVFRLVESTFLIIWLPIYVRLRKMEAARRRREEEQQAVHRRAASARSAGPIFEVATRVFLYASTDCPHAWVGVGVPHRFENGKAAAVIDGGVVLDVRDEVAHPLPELQAQPPVDVSSSATDGDTAAPTATSSVDDEDEDRPHSETGAARPASIASRASSMPFVGPLHFDSPSFNTTQCVICYVAFEEGERLREILSCRHSLHKTCLDRWWMWKPLDKGICPLCNCS